MTSAVVPNQSRFFIALIPPAAIQDYANRVIQELSDRYKTRTSPSPPHITLQAPFLWPMNQLSQLEACLSQFAANQPALTLKLSGFGHFAPRVLYINVLKTPELLTLQTGLRTHLESHLGLVDAAAQHRSFVPHMTVASRKLTPAIFAQAWSDLQSRQVDFEWTVDRFTLLLHDGERWQIRSQFLMNAMF
ncbi:MAG: 2'-5' RNA ligase family protein [Oscillatoriophycideae cyanobacterium NC_groundwater_1537_Pr4_S-0.65um_50_18]|nr:2'-5' RNA ligase family protein [Oscillatoriophycideae cyanobacterium NC_groundwater_1537_Pr4_S-0.65um_50_18]